MAFSVNYDAQTVSLIYVRLEVRVFFIYVGFKVPVISFRCGLKDASFILMWFEAPILKPVVTGVRSLRGE